MTVGVALLPLLDARNVCYAAVQSFAWRNRKKHQWRKPLYIINFEEIAYHQGERLAYHHCGRIYSLRLMIYNATEYRGVDDIHAMRDDIPLLTQWIKKALAKASAFLAPPAGLEPATS